MNGIGSGMGQMASGAWAVIAGLVGLVFKVIIRVWGVLVHGVLVILGFNPRAKLIGLRFTALMCVAGMLWVPLTFKWVASDPVRASMVMAEAGLGAMTLYRDIEQVKTTTYNEVVPEPVKQVSKRYRLGSIRRLGTEPLGVERPGLGYRVFKAILRPVGWLTGGVIK